MNKKAPRSLAILISMLLVFSFVGGCTQPQKTTSSESVAPSSTESSSVPTSSTQESSAPTTANDPLGKYDPEITLTTARETSTDNAFRPGDDWSHNHYYDNYRSQLGINITNEYEVSGGSQYNAKMNVLIASSDLPDFFAVSPFQFTQLKQAGLIQDLTNVYNNYASSLLRDEFGSVDTIMQSVTEDSKIMGLPRTNIVALGMLWVRSDWREKLGIANPKTLEDFINLTRAFIKDDPDGNGKNDTLGLSGFLEADSNGLRWIFNAFHGYPQIWYKKDGKVIYGSVQPEIRSALEYMATLYKEGVIDHEFASMGYQQITDAVNAHTLGIYDNKQWGSTQVGSLRTKVPNATLEYYQYPSADSVPAYTQVSLPVVTIYVVSKNCAHPEAVVKMANFFVDKTWNLKDATEMAYYVSEQYNDKYYNYRASAAIIPAVPLEHYKVGKECADYWDGKKVLADTTVYTQSCIAYCSDPNQWYMVPLFGKDGAITRLVPELMDSKSYESDLYNVVPTATMETKWATLQDKEAEVFVRIVMGDETIDAFDTFVKDWYSLGGQAIEDEMNARFK